MNDNIDPVKLEQEEDEKSSQTHRKLPSLVIVPDMHDVHRVLRSRDEHLSWRTEHAVDQEDEHHIDLKCDKGPQQVIPCRTDVVNHHDVCSVNNETCMNHPVFDEGEMRESIT